MPTKEMIEAVEYMAESGKCEKDGYFCKKCPLNSSCDEGIPNYKTDNTLQISAKNWLKENETKLYLDPKNPGKLTRVPNDFGSVGEINKENKKV